MRTTATLMQRALMFVIVMAARLTASAGDDQELLLMHQGDLPIVISAPHGGSLEIPDVPPRKGEGLEAGAAGFRTVRDGGTEELALAVAKAIDDRLDGSPTWVISRVHRRYVDFNRPPEIGVEHPQARVIHDQYHAALQDAVRAISERGVHGLLIDIHGQGTSATTAYRGTSNGLTVTRLRERTQEAGHTGDTSLTGLLRKRGWTVHPDPFNGREQSGFTGGYIVRSTGSHLPHGIDAIQLELGAVYRKEADRDRYANELAEAVVEFAVMHLVVSASSDSAAQNSSGSAVPARREPSRSDQND